MKKLPYIVELENCLREDKIDEFNNKLTKLYGLKHEDDIFILEDKSVMLFRVTREVADNYEYVYTVYGNYDGTKGSNKINSAVISCKDSSELDKLLYMLDLSKQISKKELMNELEKKKYPKVISRDKWIVDKDTQVEIRCATKDFPECLVVRGDEFSGPGDKNFHMFKLAEKSIKMGLEYAEYLNCGE